MKIRVDELLRREAAHFGLRFACEDCAHVCKDFGLRCSLGYPPAPRSEALQGAELELCKAFELG